MHTLANSQSAAMRQRALRFVETVDCPVCGGDRVAAGGAGGDLRGAGRSPSWSRMPLTDSGTGAAADRELDDLDAASLSPESGEATEVAKMIAADLVRADRGARRPGASATEPGPDGRPRFHPVSCSGWGPRPSCGSGSWRPLVLESHRPGYTPPTPSRCSTVLDRLRRAGNSLFVVEHDMDVVRRADWIVDVGPGAGEPAARCSTAAGRRPGATSSVGHPRILFDDRAGARREPRDQSQIMRCAALNSTTCAMSKSISRSGCSRRSPGCPGRANRRWSSKVLGQHRGASLGSAATPQSRTTPTWRIREETVDPTGRERRRARRTA